MADAAEGLTFVLPVFNQEKGVGQAVSTWLSALNSLNRPYELLLVDDGSQDGTRAQAEILATKHGRLRILTHSERRGFGACVRSALEASTQPLFFYASADPAWAAGDLARMLKAVDVRDEYTGHFVAIVNGHRRGTVLPPSRKWLNRIFRGFVRVVYGYWPEPPKGWLSKADARFWWKCRLLFGLRIGDINCPFKLFRKSAFDRIEIQSDGDFVHAEILAKANFLGCLMDEIVLADKQAAAPAPGASKESRQVFRHPKFRRLAVATTVAPPASGTV